MPNELKVAMVGAGRMSVEHIRAFKDVPGVTVVGIYSRTRERAAALAGEFKIPVVAESLFDLKHRTGAQLAVVTVSAEWMCEVACECLSLDWDVLLEKPPGYDVNRAKRIEAAAHNSSRRVWIALNRRFLSSTRAALEDLEGRSGPRYIQVVDQVDSQVTGAYHHPPEIMSHLMFFVSIHLIDYFHVFGRGAVASVRPVFSHNALQPWVVSAAIEFDSGDSGLYQAVWEAPGPWAVAVNTHEVRWELRPLERATYQMRGDRHTVEVAQTVADQRFKPGFRLQAEEVVAAVQGDPSEVPTLDQAMQTMRLIEAVYREPDHHVSNALEREDSPGNTLRGDPQPTVTP